ALVGSRECRFRTPVAGDGAGDRHRSGAIVVGSGWPRLGGDAKTRLVVGWPGAAGRTGPGAGDRPGAAASRRTDGGTGCQCQGRASPRAPTAPRVVPWRAVAGDARPGGGD